ncbi:MAG: hypothetical protein J6R92_03320 [Akkermansia sp.]|nr:hypothetical protein [Akkermansia sp.]
MASEENIQPEPEVKPAARKRAPRKKVAATPAGGEAGAPAASAAAPAKKQRAPRKKASKPAAETPVEKPQPAPVAEPAPVPSEKPAEAPASQKEQSPRKDKEQRNRQHKNNKPQNQQPKPEQTPAPTAPAEKIAEKQEDRAADIENPDAAPQLPPAPGFATPETVGGGEGGGNSRRKRRRNRNRNRENGQQPQQPQAAPQVDPQELVRRAWKIFLGEVTEEGLALMDDRTAAEASRRAFRVAELFLIEAARHRPAAPVAEEAPEEPEADDASEEMLQE